MWVAGSILCVLAFVAGVKSECMDWMPNCQLLNKQYCTGEYTLVATEACAKTCGLCEDNNSVNKRSHNHGPSWADHCWDNSANHIQDPFCALLTTTTTKSTTTSTTTEATTTTTTTEPTTTTTTTEPTTTTTTTEPTTTTTTEPTTTTTEPTTTTTMPTTTTTTLPPTTTPRVCSYVLFNDSDITNTDFATDTAIVQNSNITLNESVHLIGNVEFCKGVCEQSLLNDGFECWAFTYNDIDKCYLYYYIRPLYIVDSTTLEGNDTTQLYLKRCSDDPETTTIKTSKPTTPLPTTQQPTTAAPTTQTPTTPELTTVVVDTTMAPITTTTTEAMTTPMTESTTTSAAVVTDAPATNPPPLMTTAGQVATTQAIFAPPVIAPSGGITVVNEKQFTVTGVPSPYPNMCFFFNQSYALGEHWRDTCKYDCECYDTTNNVGLCTNNCPIYTRLPSTCQLVTVPDDCCPRLDCLNGTDINSTSTGNVTAGDCQDTIDLCDYYPDSACKEPYVPWATAHCAQRCGFCTEPSPCYDRIVYCDRYDLSSVCKDFEGWSRHNCKASCNLCTVS